MMCNCCEAKEATFFDYRTRYGTTSKYRVCDECISRTNQSFHYWLDRGGKRMVILQFRIEVYNNNKEKFDSLIDKILAVRRISKTKIVVDFSRLNLLKYLNEKDIHNDGGKGDRIQADYVLFMRAINKGEKDDK